MRRSSPRRGSTAACVRRARRESGRDAPADLDGRSTDRYLRSAERQVGYSRHCFLLRQHTQGAQDEQDQLQHAPEPSRPAPGPPQTTSQIGPRPAYGWSGSDLAGGLRWSWRWSTGLWRVLELVLLVLGPLGMLPEEEAMS